jgi:hypothetical protein
MFWNRLRGRSVLILPCLLWMWQFEGRYRNFALLISWKLRSGFRAQANL